MNNHEKLEAWRASLGLSLTDLASMLAGVQVSTVMRWCNGERTPGNPARAMIEAVTSGAVLAADW